METSFDARYAHGKFSLGSGTRKRGREVSLV